MDLANHLNPKPEAEPVRGHSAPAPARRGKEAETPDTTLVATAAVAAHPDLGECEGRGAEEKNFDGSKPECI